MSRWKRFKHNAEYIGVLLITLMIRALSLGAARGFGAFLGWVAFRIIGIRKQVTIANIRQSLNPDPGNAEAARIGLRSYQNFGRSIVEFAAFKTLSTEKLLSMITFEGLHYFDEALQGGRGAVLVTGHFDSWELLGAGIVQRGYPIHFLVGEQSNKKVDNLMNNLRRAQGIGIISRNVALKKVLRALADNQLIAMLPDQDAGRSGIFVNFLGRQASTYKGPATFAIKQKCPIIPGFMIRRHRQCHLAVIEKPIWPHEEMNKDEAIKALTQAYSDVLTRYIRMYPDHYFWAHRRWKSKPKVESTKVQPG